MSTQEELTDGIAGVDTLDDIDGPEDVNFASYLHHFTVRGKLGKLVDEGVIDDAEADQIYKRWKKERNE